MNMEARRRLEEVGGRPQEARERLEEVGGRPQEARERLGEAGLATSLDGGGWNTSLLQSGNARQVIL